MVWCVPCRDAIEVEVYALRFVVLWNDARPDTDADSRPLASKDRLGLVLRVSSLDHTLLLDTYDTWCMATIGAAADSPWTTVTGPDVLRMSNTQILDEIKSESKKLILP